jgi:hypothetical protein
MLAPPSSSFHNVGASGRGASTCHGCCGHPVFADSDGGCQNPARRSDLHQVFVQQFRCIWFAYFIPRNSSNDPRNYDRMVPEVQGRRRDTRSHGDCILIAMLGSPFVVLSSQLVYSVQHLKVFVSRDSSFRWSMYRHPTCSALVVRRVTLVVRALRPSLCGFVCAVRRLVWHFSLRRIGIVPCGPLHANIEQQKG